MSDAEIICNFMEAKPDKPICVRSSEGWWLSDFRPILSCCDPLTLLGRLHEVEGRLDFGQQNVYMFELSEYANGNVTEEPWVSIHATAEQKIAALAKVLSQ